MIFSKFSHLWTLTPPCCCPVPDIIKLSASALQSPSTYWQRENTEIRIKRTFSTVKMCAGWTFLNGPCSRPSSALRFGVINTSRAAADDSEAWLGGHGHGQSYTSLIHGTQLHFNRFSNAGFISF